jgi:hypothetical protein
MPIHFTSHPTPPPPKKRQPHYPSGHCGEEKNLLLLTRFKLWPIAKSLYYITAAPTKHEIKAEHSKQKIRHVIISIIKSTNVALPRRYSYQI